MDDYYSIEAAHFFERYQALDFETIHGGWLDLLPTRPGHALDVGAGSGRDAIALAARGWNVIAVEPAARLRALGVEASSGYSVEWLDSQLPRLQLPGNADRNFQLVLLSAVWTHLAPTQRVPAMQRLARLLDPLGILVISLRHGPNHDPRIFYETDRARLIALATIYDLRVIRTLRNRDHSGHDDVWWETLIFGMSIDHPPAK